MTNIKKAYNLLKEKSLEKTLKPSVREQLDLLSYPSSGDLELDVEVIDTVLSNTKYHPAITPFLRLMKELITKNKETVKSLIIFGSAVTGDFQKTSDIDMCLVVENRIKTPFEFNMALGEIMNEVNFEIDVVLTDQKELETTNETLLKNIKEKGLKVI